MPDLYQVNSKKKKRDIFSEDQFQYDPLQDVYRCPAGTIMKRRATHAKRQSIDYGAPRKACAACELRQQCTKNRVGRTIKRHVRQEELDTMRQASRSPKAQRDIKTRQHLMERSFARAERLGFDQARWRGLWRVAIQEYLTCIVQNIQVLLTRIRPTSQAAAKAMTGRKAMKVRKRLCQRPYLACLMDGLSSLMEKDGLAQLSCY